MQELYNKVKENVQKICTLIKDVNLFKYPLYVIIAKDPTDNSIKIMAIDQKRFLTLQSVMKLETKVNGKEDPSQELGSFFDYSLSKVKEVQEWDVLAYYFLATGYMEDDEDIIKELRKLNKDEIVEVLSDENFNLKKNFTAIIRTTEVSAALSLDIDSCEILKEHTIDKGDNIYENN